TPTIPQTRGSRTELLRERLGSTSEYTQSLIDIQAAYINTNHPAFVAGSWNALAVLEEPEGIGAAPGSSPRETFLVYLGIGVKEKRSLGGGELSMGMGMPPFGAFDMKSLPKAVDAPLTSTSSLPPPSTSTGTDLETTVIRPLVSPYFSFVRETI
ncbi:Dynamin-related GTPase protein, partial [Marasmius crinis-equi]